MNTDTSESEVARKLLAETRADTFAAYWHDYLHAADGLTVADVDEAERRLRIARFRLAQVIHAEAAQEIASAEASMVAAQRSLVRSCRRMIVAARVLMWWPSMYAVGLSISRYLSTRESRYVILFAAAALVAIVARGLIYAARQDLREPFSGRSKLP